MAILKSIADGNFTSASTWDIVDPISYIDSRTSSIGTSTLTTPLFSASTATISGLMLQLQNTNLAQSGTLKVDFLSGATLLGTTLINVNDLPQTNAAGVIGWTYFIFSGGTVPIISGASYYSIRVTSSVNNNVTFYGPSGTNLSRALVTTTNQAPVSRDTLIINGAYSGIGQNYITTVIMDNTNNDVFSPIYVDTKGKLTYQTSGSTNYNLRTNGNLFLRGGGQLEIGNSTNRIPSTSIARLELSAASINTVGILLQNGKLTAYGNPVTTRSKLNNSIGSNATVATATTVTNWKNGDLIVFPSTTRTFTQIDAVRLTADSVGNILNFIPTAFAHEGLIDGIYNCDIAHFTRNVKIFGTSTSAPYYFSVSTYNSQMDLDYVEMFNVGATSSAIGGAYQILTNITSGRTSITNSSYWYTGATSLIGMYLNSQSVAANLYHEIIFSNNNMYNFQSNNTDLTSQNTGIYSSTTITDNIFIRAACSDMRRVNIVFSGNVHTSSQFFGVVLNPLTTGVPSFNINNANFDGLVCYSNGSGGMSFGYIPINNNFTIKNFLGFRNTNYGIQFGGFNWSTPTTPVLGSPTLTILSAITFGNTISGMYFNNISNMEILFREYYTFAGTNLTQIAGFRTDLSLVNNVNLYNCYFGLRPYGLSALPLSQNIVASTAIYTKVNAYDCIFSGGTMPVANGYYGSEPFGFTSMNHNKVPGDHRLYQVGGTITRDTVIFSGSSPSIRMTPATAAIKTWTVPQKVPVNSGSNCLISVLVRKSVVGDGTAYNGSQPRLILKKNYLGGILDNILIASGTTSNGVWETLQGTTPTVTSDCVLEFFVDCDGTTGWINIDKWSTTTTNDSREMRYWFEGYPYVEIDYSSGGVVSGGEKSFVFVG